MQNNTIVRSRYTAFTKYLERQIKEDSLIEIPELFILLSELENTKDINTGSKKLRSYQEDERIYFIEAQSAEELAKLEKNIEMLLKDTKEFDDPIFNIELAMAFRELLLDVKQTTNEKEFVELQIVIRNCY